MPLENQVSFVITPETQAELMAKLGEVDAALSPQLITLNTQQRKKLKAVGDAAEPFISKALEYSKSHPELGPMFLNVADFEVDVNAMKSLRKIQQALEQLLVKIDDTLVLSGVEADRAARAYYKSAQNAVENNAAGAIPIVEDLGKRFARRASKAAKAPESPVPSES